MILIALLIAAATGCGQADQASQADAKAAQALASCHEQWRDVAQSVVGQDTDEDPSALASRWTAVIATVDYYETSDIAENCQENVEVQLQAISDLREFSEELRPYDMSYQLRQSRASIDLYLHDPLPAATPNAKGRLTRPPGKAAVERALTTLTQRAGEADADLSIGWTQMATVDLDDAEALRSAVEDLDALARESEAWVACQDALRILVAAIRAQDGTTGDPAAALEDPVPVS